MNSLTGTSSLKAFTYCNIDWKNLKLVDYYFSSKFFLLQYQLQCEKVFSSQTVWWSLCQPLIKSLWVTLAPPNFESWLWYFQLICVLFFCDGNCISLTHLDIFITGLDNGKPHLGLKYFGMVDNIRGVMRPMLYCHKGLTTLSLAGPSPWWYSTHEVLWQLGFPWNSRYIYESWSKCWLGTVVQECIQIGLWKKILISCLFLFCM